MQRAAGDDAASSQCTVAVVIPCYNESATVGSVIKDFAAALPGAEIYVFDNNSSDGTAEVALAAGARVVHSPVQGKGNVVRHMAATVDADVYVLVDGDDTYPASAAPMMVERLREQHLDMLVGSRLEDFEEGAFRTFHRIGNRLVSGLVQLLFRTDLSDVLSGYRVLSRDFVNVVQLRTGGFEVETEMTAQALTKRLAVAETPVGYSTRPAGSRSKLSTWSDGFLIARCILLLFKDYKPLAFFTALSLVLAIASLLSGSAPIDDFLETGYVLHVPRAILAAGLGVLSIVFLTAGVILDTIAKLHLETIELWKQLLRERR